MLKICFSPSLPFFVFFYFLCFAFIIMSSLFILFLLLYGYFVFCFFVSYLFCASLYFFKFLLYPSKMNSGGKCIISEMNGNKRRTQIPCHEVKNIKFYCMCCVWKYIIIIILLYSNNLTLLGFFFFFYA